MRRLFRSGRTAFLAAILLGTEATSQSPARPQETKGATVHGFLSDAITSAPIEGTVILQDTNRRPIKQAATRRGEYRINDIPEGHYFLHAQALFGHVPADYGQATPEGPPAELALAPDGAYELSFTLERTGVISGRILGPDGRPVSNAEVALLVSRFDAEGHRFLTAPGAVAPVRTSFGRYSFSSVPPGEYYIRASLAAVSDQPDPSAPINHNVQTYYPGVGNPEQGVTVEMPKASKNISSIDFIFREISQFKVAGRIVFPAEMIKDPLYFFLIPRNIRYSRLVDPPLPLVDFDDARDTFELRGVPRGSYELQIASLSDYAPNSAGAPYTPGYSARTTIEIRDEDVVGVVAELEPGVDLHGEFRLNDSIQSSKPAFGKYHPVFVPQDGKPWMLAPAATANPEHFVQADGSFDIVHASPGEYRIAAVTPENFYLSDAWLGPRNIMGQAFQIDRNSSGPLILEIGEDGAKFEGTVTDVNNAPGNSIVVLVPSIEFRSDPGTSKTARTDRNGHFVITGIRPGAYTAYAFPTIENNAWLNDDFMSAYRALGFQITFGKGTQLHRDLKQVPMPR